jgi:hypothetical protein
MVVFRKTRAEAADDDQAGVGGNWRLGPISEESLTDSRNQKIN